MYGWRQEQTDEKPQGFLSSCSSLAIRWSRILEGSDAKVVRSIGRNEILAEIHAWRQEQTDETFQGFLSFAPR